jgi:sugar phosphate isomerase/epimerase
LKLGAYGLSAVGSQALLYGTNGLHLFRDEKDRDELFHHLKLVCEYSGMMGAKAIVFGAPKNRWIDESICDYNEAKRLATFFFRELGNHALKHNTLICIEANPVSYGCNFMTHSLMTADFVRTIDSPGVRFNFDLGTTIINNEDQAEVLRATVDVIGHVHISEPNLSTITEDTVHSRHHNRLSTILNQINYKGIISIEMSHNFDIDWRTSLISAIRYIRNEYGAI